MEGKSILLQGRVLTEYANKMTLFEDILLKAFIVLFLGCILDLVFVLIMHMLMPKKILETYFKEPHFNAGEIAMFTGFPFAYMRTSLFMRALGFPASGKKRGLENAYQLAPMWYCKASKYSIYIFVPMVILLVLVIVVASIQFEVWKQ